MHSKAQLLEDSLLLVWNDRDAQRRLEKMEKKYTPLIFSFTNPAKVLLSSVTKR